MDLEIKEFTYDVSAMHDHVLEYREENDTLVYHTAQYRDELLDGTHGSLDPDTIVGSGLVIPQYATDEWDKDAELSINLDITRHDGSPYREKSFTLLYDEDIREDIKNAYEEAFGKEIEAFAVYPHIVDSKFPGQK